MDPASRFSVQMTPLENVTRKAYGPVAQVKPDSLESMFFKMSDQTYTHQSYNATFLLGHPIIGDSCCTTKYEDGASGG